MDLSFSVHNLEKFSENPGKIHFEGLLHLLGYISDNKNLGLNYYANINVALVSDLLRQSIIKTENQLIDFSDSNWKDFPDTVRSVFYQGFLKTFLNCELKKLKSTLVYNK